MSAQMVDHPNHYGGKDNPHEVIKCLRGWGFFNNALRFNTIKYLARAGKKGDLLEDLKKARWYLDEEIKEMESKLMLPSPPEATKVEITLLKS